MALKKFGFAFEIDRDLFDKAVMAKAMESSILQELSRSDYGSGVKNVAIGIIVMEPKHTRTHPIRNPVYTPGKRKARNLPVELEDTLEFDIKPPIDEVRSARNEAQLAELIRRSLGFVFPALLNLEIPNFAMDRFIADLDEALRRFSPNPS
jgi:hypothetical protein